MDSPCEGQVLLVGDGDFSFTLSLMQHSTLKGSQVTTSNIETPETIQQHQLATDNMQTLAAMGVCVKLETDARELHTHPVIGKEQYQRVIFNFPLADRHNIKKNRALLADFFSSCSQILSDEGQVMVTLCKGQGGTPADQPMRSWHDSWQVVAMASNAGYILTSILPFEASKYPEYHAVGFRFQDKSFNTEGALTHIFERADIVHEPEMLSPRGVVEHGGKSYSCSQYIAEKFKRNLMQEKDSPLCLLREKLEDILCSGLNARNIPADCLNMILPGHKARIETNFDCNQDKGLEATNVASNDKENTVEDSAVDTLESLKDKKNQANLDVMKTQAKSMILKHGVAALSEDRNAVFSARTEGFGAHNECVGQSSVGEFIQDHSESVYVLIKAPDQGASMSECPSQAIDIMDETVQTLSAFTGIVTKEQNDDCGTGSGSVTTDSDNLPPDSARKIPKLADTSHEENSGFEGRVFHFRTSLLENFSELSEHLCKSVNLGKSSHASLNLHSTHDNCGSEMMETLSFDVGAPDFQGSELNCTRQGRESSVCLSNASECLIMSGQCFVPTPISVPSLPVRHEMMIVTPFVGDDNGELSAKTTPESSSVNTSSSSASRSSVVDPNSGQRASPVSNNPQTYSSASEAIISCLKTSDLFTHHHLFMQNLNCAKQKVTLNSCSELSDMKIVYMESKEPDLAAQDKQVPMGFLCKVSGDSSHYCVLVLQLEKIACKLCQIRDPRLLWSQSPRFTNQFQKVRFPQIFSPFSLYPMKFAHDLSFWENKDCGDFDVSEMCDIIRYIAGDLVVNLALIDVYTDTNTGLRSRCYRLHFLSHDLAFPYLVSWKLQSQIRMEVAHKLGVTLR